MAELILPGVYIETRAEALIVPGPISVGNIGIVGTASSGPVGVVQVLSGYADAREIFGPYDSFTAPTLASTPLTLVRALELAYANGASTVFAVRVANTTNAFAAPDPTAMGANATIFDLRAKFPGTAGNNITARIEAGDDATHRKVTIKSGAVEEVYTVTSGTDLVGQITDNSALVTATVDADEGNLPALLAAAVPFAGGVDGADATQQQYAAGLEKLTNQNAHIIVAAGQPDTVIADELSNHVNNASTDEVRRDRIAVVGSRPMTGTGAATFAQISTPAQSSDRVIYVAPGVKASDAASGKEVTLPGAYAAAAVAGMLSARSPHISLTNKAVGVGGLEVEFNSGQLKQLVQSGVLALEKRRGFRVVKGITTDNGAFQQITTRRIVDFAKFGVRGAAEPFIGLLNNDRVRKALKGSINGFLADMVTDEMLISYELDVTATRDEEIRGIARVTMTVRPTFSIDYIKVVLFLG